ncbi:hypothetical protein PCANC_13158 [Puccinia coronata f. sp. avenae]|uniref:Uncharacterized protein n=1 Tax=Puccinia coronata f. sp. avenae TaxID=200324 RepID=A0A2N5VHZ5_9BASI|nr:hypothetical protein PCANC_13158 [Puccinia coronata f. sp. avenae]PLW49607.1 hypothetical protein PCASD_02286 [Puccinia coronata f. sp. avenae]
MSAAQRAPSASRSNSEMVIDTPSISEAPSESHTGEDPRPAQIVDELSYLHSIWSTAFGERRPLVQTPEVLSADTLAERQALLVKIQTELMPSLKQHVTDMLASVGLHASFTHPEAKLDETMELVYTLVPLLDDLQRSIRGLAPWILRLPGQKPSQSSQSDGNYGALKKHRCDRLYSQFHQLTRDEISELLEAYVVYLEQRLHFPDAQGAKTQRKNIVETTTKCCREIDYWLELSTRSDYGFLRAALEGDVRDLDKYIDQATTEIRSLGHHGRPDGSLKYRLTRLFWQAIKIGQLIRKAFRALLGSSESPSIITFPDNLNSNELDWLQWHSHGIVDYLGVAIQGLSGVSSQRRYSRFFAPNWPQLNANKGFVEIGAAKVDSRLHAFLTLISFHHIPSAAASNYPPSTNLFSSMFLQMRGEFRVAIKKFRRDAKALNENTLSGGPMV